MNIKTAKIKYLVDDYTNYKGQTVLEAVNCRARVITKKGYTGEGKYILAISPGKPCIINGVEYKRKHSFDAYCGLKKIGRKWYFYGAE